jgi:hypothetical protein
VAGQGDGEPGADGADAKPDLRHTQHEDFGVHVQRDMSGSSMFLARGSKTHYSKIQFRSQGIPRETEENTGEQVSSAAVNDNVEHVSAAPPAQPAATANLTPEQPKTVLDRLLGLFGR